jgi:hypothetical protein
MPASGFPRLETFVQTVLAGDQVPDLSPSFADEEDLALFAETGLHGTTWDRDASDADRVRLREAVQRWRKQELAPHGKLVGFTDTTLLQAAAGLLSSRRAVPVTATTLMDLAAFVNAVVLYDRLLYLENPTLTDSPLNPELMNERLEDSPVRVLRVQTFDREHGGEYVRLSHGVRLPRLHGVGAALGMAFQLTCDEGKNLRRLSDAPEVACGGERLEWLGALQRTWSAVLGRDIAAEHLFNDHSLDSDWPTPGPQLLHAAVRAEEEYGRGGGDADLGFVGAVNLRGLFNSRVAATLVGAPYVAGTMRRPFLSALYKRGEWSDRFLAGDPRIEKLMNMLDQRPVGAFGRQELRLPFFLGACIDRSNDPEHFWHELNRMRRDARPLREALFDITDALQAGKPGFDRIRRAIQSDADRLSRRLGQLGITAVTQISSSAIELALSPALPAAVLKVAITVGLEPLLVRAWLRRGREAPFLFLTSTAMSARSLLNGIDDVVQLWDLNEARRNELAAGLKRLADVRIDYH